MTEKELAERLRGLLIDPEQPFKDVIEQAAARLEQLDKDAERYRWLRGDTPAHSSRWPRWEVRHWNGKYWEILLRSELDAAIDAAMEKDK